MSVLVILIIISITIASGFLIAFIWAVKTGQLDDIYTPSVRMLFDEPKKEDKNLKENINELNGE